MAKTRFNAQTLKLFKKLWADVADAPSKPVRLPMMQRVAVCKKPDSRLTGHKY